MSEEKKIFSDKVISQMKAAGLDKPKELSWNQWNAPKKLKHRHKLVAFMAANGMTNAAIAKQLDCSTNRVSTILASNRIQLEIKRIQSEIFINDPKKRFMEILPRAIDIAEEVLENEENNPALRVDVAFRFMDRALGKPKESVEVKTSSIRDLFDQLEKMDKPKTIEVTQEDFKTLDPVDQWVQKNLGEKK